MTNASPISPSERLAALVAAGVARYVESLPIYARGPVTDVEPAQPIITLSEERQTRICLSCPLAECVDVTDTRCPLRIEQRAVWRRNKR